MKLERQLRVDVTCERGFAMFLPYSTNLGGLTALLAFVLFLFPAKFRSGPVQ